VQDTIDVGMQFAESLKGGDIVSLNGDLGVGKTVFAKGVAMGLGVQGAVISPTFVLCCEYNAKHNNLVHIDAYRLQDVDIRETGLLDKIGDKCNIVLIEWAEYITAQPNYIVNILQIDDSVRQIEVRGML
jgi:tRNA threonylcarbamoyladenosine biosynthesis protein TsaE